MRLSVGEPLEAKRPPTRTGIMRRLCGRAGPSLGRELRARALSHTAPVPAWHRLRSQSPSRVQTATSHNKCRRHIKPSSPGVKSMSADMFLDLPTMSAPSGAGAQNGCSRTGRARWAMPPPLQRCTAGCTVRAPLKRRRLNETSGLSVGGCIRARGYFGPHPVYSI